MISFKCKDFSFVADSKTLAFIGVYNLKFVIPVTFILLLFLTDLDSVLGIWIK